MNLKLVSEDSRRKLFEFGEGKLWKVAKYLEIKEECVIGDHYHRNKDELFLIVGGEVRYTIGDNTGYAIKGDLLDVPAGLKHTFWCKPGSVILCLATELHDQKDDYKLV